MLVALDVMQQKNFPIAWGQIRDRTLQLQTVDST
jgi:hypothetical protein